MTGLGNFLSKNPEVLAFFILAGIAFCFGTYLVILARSGGRLRQLARLLRRLSFPEETVRSLRQAGSVRELINLFSTALEQEVEGLRRKLSIQRETARNLSHDLGTPLTSVIGYTETLLQKGECVSEEERRKYLEIILRNAGALRSMVDEFLQISSMEEAGFKLRLEEIDPRLLCQRCYESFLPLATKKTIDLELEVPTENEPCPKVIADFHLLQRVLSNLVRNAISFTPKEGRVMIAVRIQRGSVCFLVGDNGAGIPQSEHAKIFEPFYRVNSERPLKDGGMGLGLSIVKRILELHGVAPHIESEVGRGTKVWFTLNSI